MKKHRRVINVKWHYNYDSKGYENDPNSNKSVNNQMTCCEDKFYLGFRECQDEVIRYLVEVEGWDAKEKLCNRLMAHLASSSEKFLHTGFLHQIQPTGSHSGIINNKDVVKNDGAFSQQKPQWTIDEENQTGTIINNEQMQTLPLAKVPNIFVNRSSSSDYCMSVLNGTGSMENDSDNKVFIQPMSKDNRDTNSSPMEMDSRSSSISSGNSRDPIYKFKHSITKRFSQQKSGSNPSDSSSSSSREDESDQYKWFGTSSITDSSSSRSTTSNCRKGDFQMFQLSRRYREDGFSGSSSMLPAFVLHPSGTHYIPVKIATTSVDEIFPESPVSMSGTFHPINIPVCFDRPCFLIQNVNVMCNNNSSENGESGYSTQIKSQNN
ncbi:hypothetical protein ScPMuIL_012534 [Solemya velum]